MPADRPNILFLFSDQQRWDTCGCYGQPLDVTPNLDRMAREGVLFRNAMSCQPVCGPMRSCLQSGLYATATGCFKNSVPLPMDREHVAGRAVAAGYQTAYIGKWHLAGGRHGGYHDRGVPAELRAGWQYWLASDILEFTSHGHDGHMWDNDNVKREFPKGRYRVDAQTDWVEEWLREHRDPDRPFFAMVSWIEPHHQNDHHRYEGPGYSWERFGDFVPPGDLYGTGGDWRREYPDYLGCIHALDAAVGRLRGVLDELGLAEDTVVIYSSDHGSHFRTRNSEYKRSCHEASIHVPLIACGPGFGGGRAVDDLVSLIDLPATWMDLVGAPHDDFHGRSLRPLVEGSAEAWPEDAFVQISEAQCGRAIRTARWKYGVDAPDVGGGAAASSPRYVEQYLYDLAMDPHERRNLVADPALETVRSELRARLLARIAAVEDERPEIVPADADAFAAPA